MALDDETSAEILAPDARVTDPFRVAVTTSCRALLLFSIPAAGYIMRSWHNLRGASWLPIALIPVGIVAGCVVYALLAARFGRRTARRAVMLPLAIALVVGLYVLSRYLGQR